MEKQGKLTWRTIGQLIAFTDSTAQLTQSLEKTRRSIYDYTTNNSHAATDDNDYLGKSPRIIISNTIVEVPRALVWGTFTNPPETWVDI